MSNGTEDIGIRLVVDYAKALKDVQTFTGVVGKEFNGLPKIVQQVTKSVDALTASINNMGQSRGPAELDRDLQRLPGMLTQISAAVTGLHAKVDQLGQTNGVRKLNRDLEQSNSLATKLGNTAKGIGAAMAGYQAGKMVFQPHLERMVDYDTKLAHLANVSMADKSVAQRIAGKAELNQIILGATRAGGGTRDEAIDTYQNLIGSGAVSDKDARAMLPAIMKAATASGASADQIAGIGIRSMQNFGFKATDLPKIIDMAIKSGNIGGFELKDMAKWLPAQMAEAATLGMKGEKGLAQLLALNQASITTAGSTDAAGNNVVNLLAKINSHDTQLDFKKQGINLTGSLQNAIGNGIDPLTAFASLIDRVMKKDANYNALESKIRNSKNSAEKDDLLQQQLKLAQGTAIGQVLQDRQARGAFLGFKQQGITFNKQVDEVLKGSGGTTQGNFDVISESPGFKRQQSLNETLNAQNEAMQKLVPVLDSYWEGTSKIAREYPALSTAIGGATIAVGTLAASAGSAALVWNLLAKRAGAEGLASSAGTPGGMPGSKVGKAISLLGAGAVGWEFGSQVVNPAIDWAVSKMTGSDTSLGVEIYELLHKNEIAKLKNTSYPIKRKSTFSADMQRRQSVGGETFAGDVDRALNASLQPLPIQVGGKIEIGFTADGKPFVKEQTLKANGARLDTGPTMTH